MRLNHWGVFRLLGFALFALLLLPAQALAEVDITDKVEIIKGRMVSDRVTGDALIDVSIRNVSADVLLSPIKVVFRSISSEQVSVANADGYTDDGLPYFLYSVDEGILNPNESTATFRWIFSNPARVRFSYEIGVRGSIPEAVTRIGTNGGKIMVTNPESPAHGIEINIPAGALDLEKNITLEIVDADPGFSNKVSGLSPLIEIGPTGTVFNVPISITIPYNKAILGSESKIILEESLRIYTKDEVSQLWVPLNREEINLDEGYITATVEHLSPFVVNGDTLVRHGDIISTNYLPVLFVHGIEAIPFTDHIGDCYKTFGENYQDGALSLLYNENINVYALNYDTSKSINDIAASLLLAINKIKFQTGKDKIKIISHSMGGLVSRAYIENLAFFDSFINYDASYRNDIAKLLLIGTPNHGATISHLAAFNMISGVQMTPGSDFLNSLNATSINDPDLAVDVVYSVVEPPNSWFDLSSLGDTVVSTSSAILPPEQDISKIKYYREHFLTGYYHFNSIAQVDSPQHLTYQIIKRFTLDSDNDGVTDLGGRDFCSDTPRYEKVDNNGCSFSQISPQLLLPESNETDLPSLLSFRWLSFPPPHNQDNQYCLKIVHSGDLVYEQCTESLFIGPLSVIPGETYSWSVQASKINDLSFKTKISVQANFTVAQDYDFDGFSGNIDCDPYDQNINPGAPDICDNDVDENCSGTAAPYNSCDYDLSFSHDNSMKFAFSGREIIQDNNETKMNLRLLSGSGCWFMVTPNYSQTGNYADEHEVHYLPPYGVLTINDNFVIQDGEYFQLDIDRNQFGSNALMAIDVILRGVWGRKLEDLMLSGETTKEQISLIIDLIADTGAVSHIDMGTAYLLNGETISAVKEYIIAFNVLVDLGFNDVLRDYFFQAFGVAWNDLWGKPLANILQAMSLPDKWFLLTEITENYIANPGPINGYVKVELNVDCINEVCSDMNISDSLTAGFDALDGSNGISDTPVDTYLNAINSFLVAGDSVDLDTTATQNDIDQALFFGSLARLAKIADPYSDLADNGLNNLGDILDAFGVGGTNVDRDYLDQISIEDCTTVVDWTDPNTGQQYTHEECSLKPIAPDSPTSGELQRKRQPSPILPFNTPPPKLASTIKYQEATACHQLHCKKNGLAKLPHGVKVV